MWFLLSSSLTWIPNEGFNLGSFAYFFFSSFSFLQGLGLDLPLDLFGCSVPLAEALGHFMPISKAVYAYSF